VTDTPTEREAESTWMTFFDGKRVAGQQTPARGEHNP